MSPRGRQPNSFRKRNVCLVRASRQRNLNVTGPQRAETAPISVARQGPAYLPTRDVRGRDLQRIDFMHIVKVGEDWKIINVLWELTPEAWAKLGGKPRSSEPAWPRGH
jgi:hypothetical protein